MKTPAFSLTMLTVRRPRILRAAAFSALAACLAVSAARAQTPDTASLSLRVTDLLGAVVPNATASIANLTTGRTHTGFTDRLGRILWVGLPIATYRVRVRRRGFEPAAVRVTLRGGEAGQVTLRLAVAGGRSTVTITGAVGEVNARAPQLGVRLSARQIAALPVANQQLTSLALLDSANRPALNQGDAFMNQTLFTTDGAGRRQVTFTVDGATGNDAWGRQTIFTNVPLFAVQEMTVLSNAFSAEYGASLGGAVNIVTRSGGDAWHGEGLFLARPAATEAAGAGGAPAGRRLSDTLADGAWDVSGPLAAQTQFYLAGETSGRDRGSLVTAGAAPQIFTGRYRDGMLYFRLDRQLNANHELFLRADTDAFYDTNPNGAVGGLTLPSAGRIFKRRTYTGELGETGALSPDLVNDFRAQWQLASPITQFSPVDFSTAYVVPGVSTAGNSQSALLLNHQYELSDTLSLVQGAHQLRLGVDAILAHSGGDSKEFGGAVLAGEFLFLPCPPADAPSFCAGPGYQTLANVQSYSQGFGAAVYKVTDVLASGFIQDEWRARPDLTLDLGLRYERQTFTDARLDFAPRLGFAYDFRGGGRTVLRGGWGVYYGQIPDNDAANYAISGPQGNVSYTAQPGQPGFPVSLAAAPLAAYPAGVAAPPRSIYVRPGDAAYLDSFFPAAVLPAYPGALLNPYSEQWTVGLQRRLGAGWLASADYIGSHSLRVNRGLDVDAPAPFVRAAPGETRSAAAANCSRPYWIWWYQQSGAACGAAPLPPYSIISTDVADGVGWFDGLELNAARAFPSARGAWTVLASYTYSHALDTVDPDVPSQSPNDANFTGHLEKGNAIFDQRHRLVVSGAWQAPRGWTLGTLLTLASGLPYNLTTGVDNNGDGSNSDRPVIHGVVIGRNTGRGAPIYDAGAFLERRFAPPPLGFLSRASVTLRAEGFNLLNHANVVGYNGVYGNLATGAPLPTFGEPLSGASNSLPGRELEFSAKFAF